MPEIIFTTRGADQAGGAHEKLRDETGKLGAAYAGLESKAKRFADVDKKLIAEQSRAKADYQRRLEAVRKELSQHPGQVEKLRTAENKLKEAHAQRTAANRRLAQQAKQSIREEEREQKRAAGIVQRIQRERMTAEDRLQVKIKERTQALRATGASEKQVAAERARLQADHIRGLDRTKDATAGAFSTGVITRFAGALTGLVTARGALSLYREAMQKLVTDAEQAGQRVAAGLEASGQMGQLFGTSEERQAATAKADELVRRGIFTPDAKEGAEQAIFKFTSSGISEEDQETVFKRTEQLLFSPAEMGQFGAALRKMQLAQGNQETFEELLDSVTAASRFTQSSAGEFGTSMLRFTQVATSLLEGISPDQQRAALALVEREAKDSDVAATQLQSFLFSTAERGFKVDERGIPGLVADVEAARAGVPGITDETQLEVETAEEAVRSARKSIRSASDADGRRRASLQLRRAQQQLEEANKKAQAELEDPSTNLRVLLGRKEGALGFLALRNQIGDFDDVVEEQRRAREERLTLRQSMFIEDDPKDRAALRLRRSEGERAMIEEDVQATQANLYKTVINQRVGHLKAEGKLTQAAFEETFEQKVRSWFGPARERALLSEALFSGREQGIKVETRRDIAELLGIDPAAHGPRFMESLGLDPATGKVTGDAAGEDVTQELEGQTRELERLNTTEDKLLDQQTRATRALEAMALRGPLVWAHG